MQTFASNQVNNAVYHALGERWYGAYDDPIALLRAEAKLRNPWVGDVIRRHFASSQPQHVPRVLDVGCGGGFLSNYLAAQAMRVTGIDQSRPSLDIAKAHDATDSVVYQEADALHLPFADSSFDVVCAMDFLEHVEEPMKIIGEISRVLRPGGLFFFHTFNRNPLAWLVIIKFVEWFVRNTPKNLHILRLFIKPKELAAGCAAASLEVAEVRGSRPNLWSRSVVRAFLRRRVPEDFTFSFTGSTLLAYSGYAVKR